MNKKIIGMLLAVLLVGMIVGCNEKVAPGRVGRVKTASGWRNDVLAPGSHSCFGRDEMYTVESTESTFDEKMDILVNGKVNLTITVSVRCGLDLDKDKKQVLAVFDKVRIDENGIITLSNMYKIYMKMNTQGIPRKILGSQPSVETVVANRVELAEQVKQAIIKAAGTTPLKVTAVEITNYDWPESITKAQEKLVDIQLSEAREEAKIRADLKKAEGRLKVEEANKLLEMKKAEAVAESIKIIKDQLAKAPEYLQWHQIRMLSEAAKGPNNAFILIPYGAKSEDSKKLIDEAVKNAMLKQMLDNKKTK